MLPRASGTTWASSSSLRTWEHCTRTHGNRTVNRFQPRTANLPMHGCRSAPNDGNADRTSRCAHLHPIKRRNSTVKSTLASRQNESRWRENNEKWPFPGPATCCPAVARIGSPTRTYHVRIVRESKFSSSVQLLQYVYPRTKRTGPAKEIADGIASPVQRSKREKRKNGNPVRGCLEAACSFNLTVPGCLSTKSVVTIRLQAPLKNGTDSCMFSAAWRFRHLPTAPHMLSC